VTSLFPLAAWDRCNDAVADAALVRWGHWLGGCNRSFGRQSFGLWLAGELVAVAVSASTVNKSCAGYRRQECVELARLCSHPEHRDLTQVALRLWRVTAASEWSAHYWPVRAYVAYSNRLRHSGDLYRFDGWRRVADVPGGVAGGNWSRARRYEPKSVWTYPLDHAGPPPPAAQATAPTGTKRRRTA
jgi:hypothetical protein